MKRTFALCLGSGLLGALLATLLTNPLQLASQTDAQEGPYFAQDSQYFGQPPMSRPGNLPSPIDQDPRLAQPPATAPMVPVPGNRLPPIDEELTPEERVNCAVYESGNRSVVNINTKSARGDRFFLLELPSEGAGSGAVLDRKGHVLTNFHVVDGAREIQVALFNGKTYDAQLVGQDAATDVAVIKIDAPADVLYPVAFGDSTRLQVGQKVYAIGNPFGLERTMSTGIISSLNRSLPSRANNRKIRQVIQIDASINPGNSGGPLLDSRGRMIGMNTAIASSTGESVGVGFAIPVNTISRVVPQLMETGHVVRADVGIDAVFVTERGLLIARLVPGGAAERAGLKGPQVAVRRKRQGPFVYEYQTVDRSAADLIIGVDGKPIQTADEFLSVIDAKNPGDTVQITIIRDNKEMDVAVRLDAGE